jgi:uncharacterized repeat protein (TIGR03803 family)
LGLNGEVTFQDNPTINSYDMQVKYIAVIILSVLNTSLFAQGVRQLWTTTISGGDNGAGIILSMDSAGNNPQVRYNFNGGYPLGMTPYNGKYYGVSERGGNYNRGYIFEWDPINNVHTVKYHFPTNHNNRAPADGFILCNNKFYGTTTWGDYGQQISFYEWDPLTNNFKIIRGLDEYNFVVTAEAGVVYGLFKDPSNAVSLSPFSFEASTGNFHSDFGPWGKINLWQHAKYIGVTNVYLSFDTSADIIFQWDSLINKNTVEFNFNNNVDLDGKHPYDNLLFKNGKFYGITTAGGSSGLGVIFEWDPGTKIYRKLYDFSSGDGTPDERPTIYNGMLYGILRPVPFGVTRMIFGWDPDHPLVLTERKTVEPSQMFDVSFGIHLLNSENGNLFGYNSTLYGFSANTDPVLKYFEYSLNDHNYRETGDIGPHATGLEPSSITFKNGKLYGQMQRFGLGPQDSYSFEWDPVSNIYAKITVPPCPSFICADQTYAVRDTLAMKDGKFYGYKDGYIICIDPVLNTTTQLATFEGYSVNPWALRQGKFYGTVSGIYPDENGEGGEGGSIFEWDPGTPGPPVIKYHFDYVPQWYGNISTLTLSGNKFYGMYPEGGTSNMGYIFEWDPDNASSIHSRLDLNGAYGRVADLDHPAATGTRISNADNIIVLPALISSPPTGNCENFPSVTNDNSNNNQWVAITDSKGDVLAEIQPKGNTLGLVTVQAHINNGAIRTDAMGRPYLNRSISISPASQPVSGSPVDVRLYITIQEFEALKAAGNAGINNISDLAVFTSGEACSGNVADATPVPTTFEKYAYGYVMKTSVSTFSSFYFSNRTFAALPLRFLEFTVVLQNDGALLRWNTDNEHGVRSFNVERSVDGTSFYSIGKVSPGTNSGKKSYYFTDADVENLSVPELYYRIREVDVDGKYMYSNIVVLGLPGSGLFSITPNPARDIITVMFAQQGTQTPLLLQVSDISGKKMLQYNVNPLGSPRSIYVGNFSAGIYLVSIVKNGERTTKKFIKW